LRKAVAKGIGKAADLAYRKRIAKLRLKSGKNSRELKYWRNRTKVSGEPSMLAFGRIANIVLAKKLNKLKGRRNALKSLAGRVEGKK